MRANTGEIHVSGLLVAVRPGHMDEVTRLVASVTGAAVHAHDQAGARLVLTIEGDSVDAQQGSCALLAGLPGVVAVDLVCHYVDAEDAHGRA